MDVAATIISFTKTSLNYNTCKEHTRNYVNTYQLPARHRIHRTHPAESADDPVVPRLVGGQAAQRLAQHALLSARQVQFPGSLRLAGVVEVEPAYPAVKRSNFLGQQHPQLNEYETEQETDSI